MSAAPIIREQQAGSLPLLIIERFLRDRQGVWQQIKLEHSLGQLIRQMLLSSAIGLAGYGAVIGTFHSPVQSLASALKLPIVFLLTLAICLPMLYLYNLLLGGRLSAMQLLALVLSAITVTSIFTLSFAPIVLFFLMTSHGYLFFNLLNVGVLAITGMVGVQFLVEGVRAINTLAAMEQFSEGLQPREQLQPTRTGTPVAGGLLYIWLVVYGFVGTQLGWTLRPFIGNPENGFQLFRSVEGSFYDSVFYSILNLLR